MPYLIITPLGPMNAAQRAEALSRELYCLTLPRVKQTEDQHVCKVFPVYLQGQGAALEVWLDHEIYLDPDADIEAYLSLYAGPHTDEVRALLQSATVVTFGEIYPDAELVEQAPDIP